MPPSGSGVEVSLALATAPLTRMTSVGNFRSGGASCARAIGRMQRTRSVWIVRRNIVPPFGIGPLTICSSAARDANASETSEEIQHVLLLRGAEQVVVVFDRVRLGAGAVMREDGRVQVL